MDHNGKPYKNHLSPKPKNKGKSSKSNSNNMHNYTSKTESHEQFAYSGSANRQTGQQMVHQFDHRWNQASGSGSG